MGRKFYIDNLGAQDRSPNYDTFITNDILKDICFRLTGNSEFDVEFNNNKNRGRLIFLIDEDNNTKYYINLSQNGKIRGRNYFFQSVSTALSQFFIDLESDTYQHKFCYYILPYIGNILTDYNVFIFRILETMNVNIINKDFIFPNNSLNGFVTIRDIINSRIILSNANSGNNSTYMSDDIECYSIYGKTFGANGKESVLLCLAMISISDKLIRFYQILDNDSESLSNSDIELINNFSNKLNYYNFELIDDTFTFNDLCNNKSLRSPRFNYNLLQKTKGEKKCALCNCHIDKIIQGAHIYPVSEIKKDKSLSDEEKLKYATDSDNGIWLCENHHKLFDANVIRFNKGKVIFNKIKLERDLDYLNNITTEGSLDSNTYNSKMEEYFQLRYSL